jgi:hypothetical protein
VAGGLLTQPARMSRTTWFRRYDLMRTTPLFARHGESLALTHPAGANVVAGAWHPFVV